MAESETDPFGGMIDDANVRCLVADCCNGTATEEQFATLSELIVNSPDVRKYYLAHTTLHYQLLTHYQAELPSLESAEVWESESGDRSRRFQPRLLLAIAAGIFFVLLGTYALTRNLRDETVNGNSFASVGTCEWIASDNDPTERGPGDIAIGRPFSFSSGNYRLKLTSGVRVNIAAPARFTVYSPEQLRLFHGRLTASVPENAKGFTVLTKQANIVDQGTEFGVAVEEDELTDVAVFEGKVDVATSKKTLSLVLGKAISVSRSGTVSRLPLVRPDTFESMPSTETQNVSTIVSISDNIREDESLDYYKIVSRGFGEDKRAYVDRHHQWNGVSKAGLPEFLKGADYVLPFNNDKHARDLEITVTLSSEAELFVLFDKRLEPPDWLVEGFDDLAVEVGQDEVNPYKAEGRGAGRSIDRLFSVWKKKSVVVGDVTLGSLIREGQETKEEQSMYGIVAVPVIKTVDG